MKFRQAQDIAETISAEILKNHIDMVGSMAESIIKEGTYEERELGIAMVIKQYERVIERMVRHENPSGDKAIRVANY